MMKILSIGKAWDDSRPILARDGSLMFIIALAMVMMPQTILFVINPEQVQMALEGAEAEAESPSLPSTIAILVANLLNIIGSIAISYLALVRGASVADGLRRGLQRLLPTLGLYIVLVLIAVLIGLVFAGTLVGAAVAGEALADDTGSVAAMSPLLVLGIFALVLGGIFVAVRLLLVTPVIAAEDGGPFDILKRTWRLTRGHFWRLFGFLVVFVIAVIVTLGVVGLIAGLAVALVFDEIVPFSFGALVLGLFNGLATALVTVVYSTIVARIYLQLAGREADPDSAGLHESVPPTV